MAQFSLRKFVLLAFALALAAEGAATAKIAADAALHASDAPRLVKRTGGGSDNGGGSNNRGNSGKGSDKGGKGQTTTPSSPQPSGKSHYRRSKRNQDKVVDGNPMMIAKSVCPGNLFGCPIAEAGSLSSLPSNISTWFTEGFECFDWENDLRACGGCSSVNKLHDCTSITGADSVTCEAGKCVVQTCTKGFSLDEDESACVASQS